MNPSLAKDNESIEMIFSKHRSKDNKNANGSRVQCSFTKEDHTRNNQLTAEYDKAGLMKKQNFFCLEEKEMDNPIKPKAGNNFYETVVKNELDNDYLYCGYLDNDTSDKRTVKPNKKTTKDAQLQISCSYCFNIVKIKGTETAKGVFITKALDNVFKDYSAQYNLNEVSEMIKDKTIKDNQMFNERSIEEQNLKMFISVKCLECSNLLGVKDTIVNNYILFNCI